MQRSVPFKPSSNVTEAVYDDETLDLTIKWNHGGSGTYKGVPENEVNAFSQAESAGRYLNSNIKPVYLYERR
jgi:hypothetical protein